MAGRLPKPSYLKLMAGQRGVSPDEPVAPAGVPLCPTWLLPEAKREWRRVIDVLERMQIVNLADMEVVASWCQAWAVYQEIGKDLRTHGIMTGGERVRAPRAALREFREIALLLIRLGEQLGLSPLARARLRITEPPKKSIFEQFLEQRTVGDPVDADPISEPSPSG